MLIYIIHLCNNVIQYGYVALKGDVVPRVLFDIYNELICYVL